MITLELSKSIPDEIENNFNNGKKISNVKIDETDNLQTYKKSFFSDIITKKFINIIGEKNLFYMASYVYSQIYLDIDITLNYQLKNKNYKPLNANEDVMLLFKGGNLYNYYFTEFFNQQMANTNNNLIMEMIGNLKENFTISDNDYELVIICDNENRFMELYEVSIMIIYKSLDDIRNFFETIYEQKQLPNINNVDIKQKLIDPVSSNLIKYLSGIVKSIRHLSSDIITQNAIVSLIQNKDNKIKILNDNLKNTTLSGNVIKLCNLLIVLTKTVINYIDIFDHIIIFVAKDFYNIVKFKFVIDSLSIINRHFQIFNNLKERIKIMDASITNRIDILKKNYKTVIKNNNFYSEEKMNNLLSDIINTFNQKSQEEKTFYEKENEIISKYLINDELQLENIEITNKSDIVITLKSDNTHIISSTSKHIHYISYNNTIAANTINFDLIRIKFNVELKNAVKKYTNEQVEDIPFVRFPSEFVDISIKRYQESGYQFLKQNVKTQTCFVIINDKIIQSYNFVYALHDLQIMIFRHIPFPWINTKCNKVITRMTFCIALNIIDNKINKNMFTKLLTLILNISLFTKRNAPIFDISDFTNNQYSSDIIQNKLMNGIPFYDLINVKPLFTNVKYLVNFLIVIGLIYKDDSLLNIINYQRQQYNYINISDEKLDDFKASFDNFIQLANKSLLDMYMIHGMMR